jgi:hypothetical protein
VRVDIQGAANVGVAQHGHLDEGPYATLEFSPYVWALTERTAAILEKAAIL